MASSNSHRLLEAQADVAPPSVSEVAVASAGEHDAYVVSPARLLQAQVETALMSKPTRKLPLAMRLAVILVAATSSWIVIALVLRALMV